MPMNQLEHDSVAKMCAISKQILNDVQPKLASINELYNSEGGVSSTLTQEELDEELALSNLQKQTLDDCAYAFANILSAIQAAYPAISQVAARFL